MFFLFYFQKTSVFVINFFSNFPEAELCHPLHKTHVIMRRSSSEPGIEFQQAGLSRRWSSSPSVSSSGLAAPLASPALALRETCEMRGDVLLKHAPDARKTMRVVFVADQNTLKIIIKQKERDVTHDFVLCTLDLATLFVGWDSADGAMFCIGAKWQGIVYHTIYCYPCACTRGLWLFFLKERGCEIVSMSRARRHSQEHMNAVPEAHGSFGSAGSR
jgi:hypothetical protein